MTEFSQLLLLQIDITVRLNFLVHQLTSKMMIYVAVKAKTSLHIVFFLYQITMLKQPIVLKVPLSISNFKCLEASLGRMFKTVFQIKKATEKSQFIRFQRMSKEKGNEDLITAKDMA